MTTPSLIDPAGGTGAPVDLSDGAVLVPLRNADIPALAAAMAAIDPWRSLGYGAGALERYWQRLDGGAARLGVLLHGRCAGALCVRPRWLRGPFLELLCLLPIAQGEGRGGRILNWLATVAAALGPNLWTSVDSGNGRALAFYRRHGFAEVARLPKLLAPDRDELLLRRILDTATRGGTIAAKNAPCPHAGEPL
jgi:GNAT superfamily N-acetyltransferase